MARFKRNNWDKVEGQFSSRSDNFDISAHWITDQSLIDLHLQIAGNKPGMGLELCCGTGILGRSLLNNGWQMTGLDLTAEMVAASCKYFPTVQHNIEDPWPFKNNSFDLVILRQALFFFSPGNMFKELKRVLKDGGAFIISQTVPFSHIDLGWLSALHKFKQSHMLCFYTAEDIEQLLINNGFVVDNKSFLTVRESITRWMKYAPELSKDKKDDIINMIKNAPDEIKKLRNIKMENNELLEDWNWVVLRAKSIR